MILGDPREFHTFVSPSSIYAHELGHHFSSFDLSGKNIFTNLRSEAEKIERLRASLTLNGSFNGKYLHIPYDRLPSDLLYRPQSTNRGFLYFVWELVADKVALQLCGYDESKKRIEGNLKEALNSKEPWLILHLLVLAREYKLENYEKILLGKIKKHEKNWSAIIPTEQLLNSLSTFFNNTTLKAQPQN